MKGNRDGPRGASISPRLRATLAAALVLGVHLCLLGLYWVGGARSLWGDEKRYLASARALLDGDPSWWPEPLWPPLSSQFIAAIMVIFGDGMVGVHLVQTALLGVGALVFGDLTRRWTGSRTAGYAGVLLMVTFPPLVAFAHYLWPEVLHLVLALIALWALAVRGGSWFWCGFAGVTIGLCLLTKSLLGPFVPVLLVATFWGDRQPHRVRRLATCIVVIALTVAPVVWAQKKRVGSAVIANSAAFNLWVGLNDRGMKSFEDEYVARAFIEFREAEGSFEQRSRDWWRRCFALIRQRGLAQVLQDQVRRQYFRFFDKDSYLTEQLPGGAAVRQGVGYRGVSPKLAAGVRSASYAAYALILLAAPLGYLAWPFRDRRWTRVMLLFLAYNLGLFLLLHVKSRYRIQVLPVAFLGTAAAVAWARERIEQGFAGQSLTRLGIAGLVGLCLLGLAFSGGNL